MQKGQKEKKHASARCRKAKKRKNMLLHDAERPKREKHASARCRKAKKRKTCFCTMQKGQKEKKHASARRRKVKKRKNTFLSDSERAKRGKIRFWVTQKGLKRGKTCFWVTQKGQKEERYVSEWLRTIKKRKVMLLSDSERSKRRITKKKVDYWAQREREICWKEAF